MLEHLIPPGMALAAIANSMWRSRRSLDVTVIPCRADGSYVRGADDLTHLLFTIVNDGEKPAVLDGLGVRTRCRPGAEAGCGWEEHVLGEQRLPLRLEPGDRYRGTCVLTRDFVAGYHELEAVWAQDTTGRKYRQKKRRVNELELEILSPREPIAMGPADVEN